MRMLALCVLACSMCDTHVSCAPTLTCTLNDARFKPPPVVDAGPTPCDASQRRCRAIAVAAGGAHTCAIARAGELFCWGSDSDGQLGRMPAAAAASDEDAGSEIDFTPVLQMAKRVAAGGAHTCVLVEDGSLFCFGRDDHGQVSGSANKKPVLRPRRVALDGVTQIATGDAHSCAVVRDGVACWGSAAYGQVGREVMDGALAPELVPGTESAVEVATGTRHSCARTKNGHVLCWGELIDPDTGTALPVAEPTEVPGLTDATAIAAGAGHSCAIRQSGEVVCWGNNESGQLGDGTTHESTTPVSVASLPPAVHIAAGGAESDGKLVGFTCAVDRGFYAQCWGRNVEGELGIGHADDSSRPSGVLGLEGESDEPYLGDIIALAAGAFHMCVLDNNDRVLCWGDDRSGQLGATGNRKASFGRVSRAVRFSRFD
jgi:alpha-tubulin suppressor-like RCC1 family protein